jgi:hypothetical protein
MTTVYGDTLVFKIEDINKNTRTPNNIIFIFYDTEKSMYVIRGKRADNEYINYEPYNFNCKSKTIIENFIKNMKTKQSLIYYTLYNYKDLPINIHDITYDELIRLQDDSCTIIEKYDYIYKTNYIIKFLTMLKNMFNYY